MVWGVGKELVLGAGLGVAKGAVALVDKGVEAAAPHGQSPHLARCHSSAPAPPQGAPGGSGQPGTPSGMPSHWDPSRCLGCSSEPPPKSPMSLRVALTLIRTRTLTLTLTRRRRT